jgi:hypothetical protein
VTKNCEDALRRLRREDSERVLWVDAISINQQNEKEKGHQVSFMGPIYQHAAQVVIWLGDASETIDEENNLPDSDLFFDFMSPLATEMQESKLATNDPSTPLYNKLVSEAADYVTTRTLTPLVRGFLDVVLRPWWERVWVVQEAALAKSAIVICGGKTANYTNLYDLWYRNLSDVGHESGLTYSLLEGYKHHMFAVLQIRDYTGYFGPAKTLLGVLDRCRRLRATDERDHIFAMFGMFDEFKSQLPEPDYRKSSPEVFAEMARTFLEQMDSLAILLQATNVENDLKFPSWVTDFSQRPKFHIPSAENAYHASGDSAVYYEISDNGKELKLLGKCCDMLEDITKAPIEGYYNPYVPKKAILGYQQDCRVGQSITNYPTGEPGQEVLWRTMCWNIDVHYNYPAAAGVGIPFENFRKSLMSAKDVEVIEKEILLEDSRDFNNICVHSMPLCITKNGYLASVPWTAEKGDQIIIFSGGDLPFVLRKDPTGGHYRLIGVCYVHGIMGGEAFPEDSSDLEWFSIR